MGFYNHYMYVASNQWNHGFLKQPMGWLKGKLTGNQEILGTKH